MIETISNTGRGITVDQLIQERNQHESTNNYFLNRRSTALQGSLVDLDKPLSRGFKTRNLRFDVDLLNENNIIIILVVVVKCIQSSQPVDSLVVNWQRRVFDWRSL